MQTENLSNSSTREMGFYGTSIVSPPPPPTKSIWKSVTLWLLATIATMPALIQVAKIVWPDAVPALEAIVPVLQDVIVLIAAVRHVVVTAQALTFNGVVLRKS